ncbi:choice-of-anchor R domain-containing protein [Nostoc sp. PCC 9305]|uniref:choice-of-anchor R domain-containing protein n=1 Tax=Nostoc sp. PCC 9305 TaxID=296636 RepID=UPI0039C659E9
MENKVLVLGLATLALTIVNTQHANAAVLYDSLTDISSVGSSSVTIKPANSFSTDSTAESLTSVVLSLKETGVPGISTLSLLSDSSTSPGSSLLTIATINDSTLTGSLTDYIYTLATPYTLAANTRYWIQLTTENNSSARWSYSGDGSGVNVANEYWYNTKLAGPNSEGPYQLQVNVVPVPESYNLLGLGAIAGLGLIGGLKRKLSTGAMRCKLDRTLILKNTNL